MKLKIITAAVLTSLASISSHAVDTDWMTHDVLESELVFFGPGVVADTFSFSLGAGYFYDVSSKVIAGGFTPGFAFYGLFNSADVSLGAFAIGSGLNTVTLGAGDYYYSVLGVSPAGGAYSISSAIVATPVPEPETYAMMLAGLGVLGFLASRRRRED